MELNPLKYLDIVVIIMTFLTPIFLAYFWLVTAQTLKSYSFQLYENVQIMCKVYLHYISFIQKIESIFKYF